MESSNAPIQQNKSLDGVSPTRTDIDDRQKRTESSGLPYHNWAVPSRPMTPDESVIDATRIGRFRAYILCERPHISIIREIENKFKL